MVAIETEKNQFFNYRSNGCYVGKKLLEKRESYRFDPPLQNLNFLDHCRVR